MLRSPFAVLAAGVTVAVLAAGVTAFAGGPSAAESQTEPFLRTPMSRGAPHMVPSPGLLVTGYLARQARTAKADLIERLTSPPQVVIFGGSRAMRFDPAYIERRTGLSGFNVAVTQARATDTWAFVNLLHARFPTARFRFLWILHADQFDARTIDPAILMNPTLARFFPASLVKSQLPAALALAERRQARVTIDLPNRGRLVYAPDGYARRGFFSNATPPPNGHVGAIAANIRSQLEMYRRSPAAFFPRSVRSFEKDLRLMDSLAAAPPVIVAAPFDNRIRAAIVNHGWGARHRHLLRLLARLRRSERFSFVDLSNAAASGITARDFYDGIHLTRQGADKVVDLVLKRFPRGLQDSRLLYARARSLPAQGLRPAVPRWGADTDMAAARRSPPGT